MSHLMTYSRIGNKLRKPTLWLPQGKTYGNYNVGFRFFCFLLLLDVSRTVVNAVFRNENLISWERRPRLFFFAGK